MKRIVFAVMLMLGSVAYTTATAQVRVNVNVNIGSQPLWGPVGYDYAEYYYMPDIDVYYSVPQRLFIYPDRGRWVKVRSLPARYGHYDLYNGYKVVINERDPYLHHDVYRARYASYRGRHDQVVIRDSHDPKYYKVKGHPGKGNKKGHHKH